MGNSNKANSSLEVLRQAQPGEWLPLATLGHCQLVKNSQRGIEAEQYIVQRDTSLSEQEELSRYEFRCVHDNNLVKVYQVERLSKGQQQAVAYRVKTERIIARLAELKDLGFEQGLFIFREALKGYQTILKLKGPVNVTDRMVGVSQQGRVKVWVSENFGRSSPEPKEHRQLTETAMVDTIYRLVSKHLKNGSFPQVFRQTYEQSITRNFQAALQLISQFAGSNNLHLPDKLNLTPVSAQKSTIVVNGSAAGMHPPNIQLANHQSQQRIVSQPIIPLQGSVAVEQVFRQPSNLPRKELHEVHSQQRLAVSPRLSAVQVLNSKPTTPSVNHGPRPSHPVISSTNETIVTHHLQARNVVTPVQGRGSVLLSDRQPVSPRPVVSRSPIREIVSPAPVVTMSTVVEPTAIVSHPVLPRVASSQGLVNRHPPSYQYPRNKHIDMRNAVVTAVAESEVVEIRTKEDKPHVTYVPADPEYRRDIGHVEKRDTVALPTQRAKSEYIHSIMSKPTTPTARNHKVRRTLYESRNRELHGQPILHEGYDEFMRRLKHGERPKSQLVRASFAGGRADRVIEKRPAEFAAEKIVTGETTVERSPRKKYVSADPISLGQTKNEMNKKNKKLIKFPIKKQVVVKGYERQSFESNLNPILKQTQSTREIPLSVSPRVVRDTSPEETPWKGMNVSGVITKSTVVNPEVLVGVPMHKSVNLSTSNVQFSYNNQQPHIVQQTRISPPHAVVETVTIQQVQPVVHVQPAPVAFFQQVVQPIEHVHIEQVIHQPNPVYHDQQQQPMKRFPHSPKDVLPNIDFQHPVPAPAEKAPYQSSEEILRIIEESKKYRMGASASLEQTLKSHAAQNSSYNAYEQPVSFKYTTSSAAAPVDYQYRQQVVVQSAEDDLSSLRPETLFQPKPPSRRQQINYSIQSESYTYSQPISQQFYNAGVGSAFPTTVIEASPTPYGSHQLSHSFGNSKPAAYQQQEYEEQEFNYYQNGRQTETTYYRQEYEQIGTGGFNNYNEVITLERTADFRGGFGTNPLESNDQMFRALPVRQ